MCFAFFDLFNFGAKIQMQSLISSWHFSIEVHTKSTTTLLKNQGRLKKNFKQVKKQSAIERNNVWSRHATSIKLYFDKPSVYPFFARDEDAKVQMTVDLLA